MQVSEAFQSEVLSLLQRVEWLARVPGIIAPVNPEDIRDLERTLGGDVPRELVEWVTLCDGAAVNPGGLYSVREIISFYRVIQPAWLERGWIPVASDGCGDIHILDTRSVVQPRGTHPVYFVDQCDFNQPDYVVASGLWRFLKFLLEHEIQNQMLPLEVRMDATAHAPETRWPFNKAYVLSLDPDLDYYEGNVRMPWRLET